MKTKAGWSSLKDKLGNLKQKNGSPHVPRVASKRKPMDDSDDDIDEGDLRAEEERNLLEFKIELLIDMLIVREMDRRREIE
eukprot:1758262-Pyramimonas_sp.AAC.1